MRLGPFDFAIALLSLAAVAASFVVVYSGGGGRPTVNLRGDGGLWIFPLDAEELVTIPGPLGDTIVEIGGGGARVVSSPCPDQVCVVAGAIRSRGQWSACLPNRVMLYVSDASGDDHNHDDADATAW